MPLTFRARRRAVAAFAREVLDRLEHLVGELRALHELAVVAERGGAVAAEHRDLPQA
jgi:hypothetical protein